MAEMVGGLFATLTANKNEVVALAVPSLTVRVTFADPNWLVAGNRGTVPLEPLPPKVMFPAGSRLGLEELPLTFKLAAVLSTSPTVNGIGPSIVFTVVT